MLGTTACAARPNLQGRTMKYKRVRVEGGCYFFTVALADRKSDLLVANINLLRAAIKEVKANHPFYHWCDGGFAWSHTCVMDVTPRGRQLFNTLDVDKTPLFHVAAKNWKHKDDSPVQTWTQNLATSLLGAHHPRRTGFSQSHWIHSLQSGKTRLCKQRERLAVFKHSQICLVWCWQSK